MKHLLLLILFVVLPYSSVLGQEFTVSYLSSKDGLPKNVTAMYQDEQGYIWMNSYRWLTRYDGYSFVKYPLDNEGFTNHFVSGNALWFYKDNLVKKVTFHNGSFNVKAYHDKKHISSIRKLGGKCIYRGSVLKKYGIHQNFLFGNKHYLHTIKCKNGFVMTATYGNGLFIYDPKTGVTRHFDAKDKSQNIINTNNLLAIMQDRSGCVWISQEFMDMVCLTFDSDDAEKIRIENVSYESPVNNIRAIAQAPNGKIFVGNMQGEVYEYNVNDNSFKLIFKQVSRIYSIFIDNQDRLWIGTRGNGLYLLSGNKKYHFLNELPSKHVYDILQDKSGTIWIACFEGGLVSCHESSLNKFSFKRVGNMKRPHDLSLSLSGKLLVAADDDVCLLQTLNGVIWKGTHTNGMHSSNGKWLTMANGLVNNTVNALTEDSKGNIWAATDEGISCIDPRTGNIHNHYFARQPLGDAYNEDAVLRLNDGTLLFGSKDGIVKVYPQLIVAGKKARKPLITSMLVNGDSTIYNLRDKLNFKYSQNNVTFNFSDFDYANQSSVLYSYKVDGVDKGWSNPTKYNFAIYRNLRPGNYYIHVRSKSSDNEWSAETTLEFVIRHPWWNTWWAWGIYIILTIIIMGYVLITLKRMLHLHNELEIEKRISAFKSEFYDQISREFRNPLSLIQGASENLSTERTTKTTIQVLRKGSKRMMALMEQVDKFTNKDVSSEDKREKYREEIAKKIDEIKNTAEAGDVKEMLSPSINDAVAFIIEDDADALALIEAALSPYIKIAVQKDSSDFLELIRDKKPTIIILDKEDDKSALKLVKSIKRDKVTSAIPVIQLSSFSDNKHQLDSTKAGVDLFMAKPFSTKVLIASVLNLISKQRTITTDNDEPKEKKILTKVSDKSFKDKLDAVIGNHLGDEDFDVNKLADLMGYSRAQIYNKVKDLMGVSPVEYIRNKRMDYAAYLLKTTSLSVTEIMYKVGIKTTAHFYTTFQKKFGMSPTQYRKQS